MESFEDFKWGESNITIGIDPATVNSDSIDIIVFRDNKKMKSVPLAEFITLSSRGSSGKQEQFNKSLEDLKKQIDLMRVKNKVNE